jgi:putative acetyltransferase
MIVPAPNVIIKLTKLVCGYGAPNNSFNPTALSVPFMMLVWLRLACIVSSGGGLIRAFGGSREWVNIMGMSVQGIENINIRPATNQDRERVISLVSIILPEYGLRLDLESSEADLKDIEGTYLQSGGTFEVVEDKEGHLLGTFGLYPLGGETCKLRKMYLVPQVRGIGLGRYLLEHAIAAARKLGFRVIILETVSVMKEAIRLYTRMGFKPVKREAASPRCDRVYTLNLVEQ